MNPPQPRRPSRAVPRHTQSNAQRNAQARATRDADQVGQGRDRSDSASVSSSEPTASQSNGSSSRSLFAGLREVARKQAAGRNHDVDDDGSEGSVSGRQGTDVLETGRISTRTSARQPRRGRLGGDDEPAGKSATSADSPGGSGAEVVIPPASTVVDVYRPGTRQAKVTSLADRRAEQARDQRHRRTRVVLYLAAAASLLAVVVYIVVGSSLLALDPQESTIGGQGPDTDVVAVEAIVQDHAETPLLLLDVNALAQEISEVTGVRQVVVIRDWPQAVVVEIEPRLAVANVVADSGFEIVDDQGHWLAHVDEPRAGLPQVDIPLAEDSTEARLQATLEVLGNLPQPLLEQVVTAGAGDNNWVQLNLTESRTVVWGSAEDGELKAAVLATLLGVTASEYDVSAPLAPVTR